MENQMELFDQYLDDKLSLLEKNNFELKLQQDESFRKEFELHKKAIKAIEFAAIKEKIHKIGREAQQTKTVSLRTVLTLAASITLLVGAYFFMMDNYSTGTNYNDIYASIDFKDPGLPTLMGEAEVEHGMDDFMIAYKLNKYDEAWEIGQKMMEEKPGNDTIQFYLAMIHYEQEEIDSAEEILLGIENPETSIGQKSEWYLTMIALRNGEIAVARERFERMASDRKHILRMEAIDALDVLDLEVK